MDSSKPKFTVVPGPTQFEPHDERRLKYVRKVETRLVEDGNLEWFGGSLLNSKEFDRLFRRLREHDREKAIVLFMDRLNVPIGYDEWTGGIDFVALDIRQIFKVASMLNASKIVMAHNHPEGNPAPSKGDELMCLQLCQLARLMDWEIYDFLVLGSNSYVSFRDSNNPNLLRPAGISGRTFA
jgi:DNA repair protein RadC